MFLRVVVALALAALAALWLGRKFARPLSELTDGARAFNSRDFSYRIPADGENEFAAVAEAMNEMAEETSRHLRGLEDDARRRRRFLADVAHELRGPITTMRTMAGALQDGVAADRDRQTRAVSVLVRTSERMLRLVQDIMQIVELDLDKLPVNKSETDIRSLVAGAMASHEAQAVQANVTLKPLDAGAPVKANVDADRISQVLDNVIGNAICHAGTGASVSAVVEDADPIRISITDTGVGIPAEELPHVLDPFYRVNPARTLGDNHIGLGLSIARRIADAHGGELLISSEEGKGTNVTVLIPRRQDTNSLYS